MILCSLVMGLGTSIGGYRIIKSVGMDMVKLEKYQGFSADVAGAEAVFSIIINRNSLLVLPHTKLLQLWAGVAKRLSNVNWAL